MVAGCVAAPRAADLSGDLGGPAVAVVEHGGDDRCRGLEDELAEGGAASSPAGIPASFRRLSRASGVMGCPPRLPGNSQRASALVAVARLSRWPMWRSSRLAKGSGTGAGGSPSRIATCPSSWMTLLRPEDAGQRLGVEQHHDGRDAGEQLRLLVDEEPPEQVQALLLADRGRVGGVLVRHGQPGQEPVGHRPAQEGVGQLPVAPLLPYQASTSA